MRNLIPLEPIDYLVIGHVTQDITPNGPLLGGTAAYAALTAKALGLRVGIVTAHEPGLSLPQLEGIQIAAAFSDVSTTFENTTTPNGRVQHLYQQATPLDFSMVPELWRKAPIVHLGPVAQEVDPKLVRAFPESLIGVTPQGWMRAWDKNGLIHYTDWLENRYVLESASAAVISVEDVHGDESLIDEFLSSIRILVVTEGSAGCRLYWNGDLRYFRAPQVTEVDPTGAGDIFAATFFTRLSKTRDPWEAARYATMLASTSVTRRGMAGVPTPDEVYSHLVEILP